MEATEKVLKAMKVAGTALKGGDIAKLSGLDQKSVDKSMKELKSKGLIDSPKKCYWQAK
jgi:Mn-dependent DtxR family transcriptional regulator